MNINKKKLLIILAIGVMLAIAGCTSGDDGPDGEQLEEETGEEAADAIGEAYHYEIGITENNQQTLVRERPPFQMDDSLERQNLIERFQHLNDRNQVHHVYLMSHDGKVIAYFTAQGKVSSVNSKLTNDRQIVKAKDCHFRGGSGAGSNGACHKVVESPQMDGSYGENGDGIFFFTTDGHYVEWNGLYVVSEEPKQIQTQVTLVEDVNDDGTPVDENGNEVTADDGNESDGEAQEES